MELVLPRYTVRWVFGVFVAVVAASSLLLWETLSRRYERDVSRMVFNDNVVLLQRLRRQVGSETDSLTQLLTANPAPTPNQPYLVVSIEEHRLWYRLGDSVLFTAEVATGSGRVLERSGGDTHWRFETPRGRLFVVAKETDPVWIPPEWHYVEEAQRRGLGIVRLSRGQEIPSGDGGLVRVTGSDVVKVYPDGRQLVVPSGETNELVVAGNIIIPPFGTNQRKYRGVLGTYKLDLGDGYAIHGTNKPETIGQSVSHGCVRLRNEDVAALYATVPVGTPVFIY